MLSAKQKTISLILKAAVVISAVLGTFLSAYAGRDSFMGGKVVFMYFTIQSNIAIALICAIGGVMLLSGKKTPAVWSLIKYVGTVSITLTGMVFCFVLAPTLGIYAWNVQNILTHVVVPAAAVADFFVTAAGSDIRKKDVFWVILPPIAYAVYAGIAYANNWQFAEGINYPYFFLNWGSPAGAFGFTKEMPYMGCVWWIALLLVFLIIVGYLYLKIADGLKRKKNP